jgi:hypothetical protein
MAEMSSSGSGLTDLPPLLDQMREKVNREQYVGMGGGGHQRDCTIFSCSITLKNCCGGSQLVSSIQSVAVSK